MAGVLAGVACAGCVAAVQLLLQRWRPPQLPMLRPPRLPLPAPPAVKAAAAADVCDHPSLTRAASGHEVLSGGVPVSVEEVEALVGSSL